MNALVATFAVVALACIGIYGMLAFTVSQHEREIGIRLALGAPEPGVIALVLRDGLRLALAGLAVGLPAAIAGGRLFASFPFGVSPRVPEMMAAILAETNGQPWAYTVHLADNSGTTRGTLNAQLTPLERHAHAKNGQAFRVETGVASGDAFAAMIQDYDSAGEVLHAQISRDWYVKATGDSRRAIGRI